LRVLMVSKACVVGMYQRKLEEIATASDIELHVVVPPYWKQGGKRLILDRAYTSGYELHQVPVILNGHFHLHFYPTLGRLMRDLRPDLVHVDEEPYNLATFLAMRQGLGVKAKPLFFTWQNLLRRYPWPFSSMEAYNLAHAPGAIAGNHGAEAVLRAKGYLGRVSILPQFGVDPRLFRPKRREGTSAELVVGYVGRMVEEKGVHHLLQALAGLKGAWRLRLVGDGPFLPRLESLATGLGVAERVLHEPWRSSPEMPDLYRELDVLVLPSLTRRNWMEQFGRVLIEAMACEVTVIGSSSGEIPRVIGDAGLVFEEGNVAELRARLEDLMAGAALRAELGRRGRERVLECYTQARIASETCNLYRQVLAD